MALRVTASLWGLRAQSLLLGVLDSEIEELRLVAIEMLEVCGRVDDWAIERLVADRRGLDVVAGGALQGRGRLRVRGAGEPGGGPHVPEAAARSGGRTTGFGSLVNKVGPKEPSALILELARSLVTLDPVGARPLLQKLAVARGDLRRALDGLTAGT